MRARIQKISRYAPSVFQGRIDFARKKNHAGVSLTIEHPFERLLLRLGAGSLVLLALLYVYFVGASILNVIARKEALSAIATESAKVTALEREYLETAQRVGPEDGARLGLSPVVQTAYVRRPGNAALAGEHAATLESNDL